MERKTAFYPLTSSQKLIVFTRERMADSPERSISVTLHFKTLIDESLMLQAMTLALMRNQSISLRFTRRDGELVQYFSSQPPERIEVVDYTQLTQRRLAEDTVKWCQEVLWDNFYDVPLYRVLFIRKPDGNCAFFFRASHLIFDSYSLLGMANDALSIYVSLRDEVRIARNRNNALASMESDISYQASPAYAEDMAFWLDDVFEHEPLFTSVNGLGGSEFIPEKRYGHVVPGEKLASSTLRFSIPSELVSQVISFSKSLKVSPQCVYLLAARSFLSQVNGGAEDVTVYNSIARRSSLIHKRGGGTRISAVPFRMEFSNTLTFTEACIHMHELQYRYYLHSNASISSLLERLMEKYDVPHRSGYVTLAVTYQPYFITANPTVPVELQLHTSGFNIIPVALTMMAVDASGALECVYDFLSEYISETQVDLMHSFILRFVSTAIAHPGMTLEELMEL